MIAYNDLVAIGVMRGLTSSGLCIPGDVSVLGFDDIFAAELVTPSLTTVAAPLSAVGGAAVRHLLAVVRGAQPRLREPAVVPTRLVVRESTGQRSRKRISPAFGTTRVPGSVSKAARSTAAGSR